MSGNSPWDSARPEPEEPSEPLGPELEALQGGFIGQRGQLLGLALKSTFLTIITLGFYRFWMKTRLRRWYWSAVRVGGIPAEYVGDPLEKLLGFLIAVAFLAFYIGIVNLILMFLSFSLFQGNVAAYLLSFLGVVPLWFYASYRARRYVLARTRWRGIRFGLAPGAWGYAWRAMVHWAITIVTVGLLWPRMTFWLEKYRTDRTWFGDVQIAQEGRWQMLFPALKHILWPVVVGGAATAMVGNGTQAAILALPLCIFWATFGIAYYRTKCWEILTNHKRAGGIVFRAQPSAWRVYWIYVFGHFLTGLVIASVVAPVGFVLLWITGVSGITIDEGVQLGGLSMAVVTGTSVVTYFTMFLLWSTFTHVFVTMPLWEHYSETLTVIDPGELDQVRQRPRDEFAEAEGYAEALDVGAAI